MTQRRKDVKTTMYIGVISADLYIMRKQSAKVIISETYTENFVDDETRDNSVSIAYLLGIRQFFGPVKEKRNTRLRFSFFVCSVTGGAWRRHGA